VVVVAVRVIAAVVWESNNIWTLMRTRLNACEGRIFNTPDPLPLIL
jgi:hypothetical protein